MGFSIAYNICTHILFFSVVNPDLVGSLDSYPDLRGQKWPRKNRKQFLFQLGRPSWRHFFAIFVQKEKKNSTVFF